MDIKKVYETPTGDKNIINDLNVSHGETKPGELDKPIHEDVRGVIQRLNKNSLDWIEPNKIYYPLPNILYTKKGFMRSGDLHKNVQYDIIISGKLELWTLQKGDTIKDTLGPNTFIILHPYIPHLFNFLEDTVMLEWWGGPFEAWFYKPYRDIIDQQFKKMTQK